MILDNIDIHIKRKDNAPLAVLGVLATEKGLTIKDEMLKWLTPIYEVHIITQQPPGELFEYPAIQYAQQLSLERHQSVLYLHTKGAAHDGTIQRKVRDMWKTQFTKNMSKYFIKSDDAIVTCPYTGCNRATWFNGFVANEAAWKLVKLQKTTNRYYYEHIFREYPIEIKGILNSKIDKDEKRKINKLSVMFNDLDKYDSKSWNPWLYYGFSR